VLVGREAVSQLRLRWRKSQKYILVVGNTHRNCDRRSRSGWLLRTARESNAVGVWKDTDRDSAEFA
jgi:hypothetical protein